MDFSKGGIADRLLEFGNYRKRRFSVGSAGVRRKKANACTAPIRAALD